MSYWKKIKLWHATKAKADGAKNQSSGLVSSLKKQINLYLYGNRDKFPRTSEVDKLCQEAVDLALSIPMDERAEKNDENATKDKYEINYEKFLNGP